MYVYVLNCEKKKKGVKLGDPDVISKLIKILNL